MANASGDRPPPFNDEKRSFYNWKREVEIWRLGTNVDKKKQAPRIIQVLPVKLKDHCTRIDHAKLTSENGVEDLLKVIEEFYAKDGTQQIFIALDRLDRFKRPPEMDISEYLKEFDTLNCDVAELLGKNPYEDGVLAYRLMTQCNLTTTQQQLVRATIPKLEYKEMKNCIRKIYGDRVILGGESKSRIPVKEEVFYQNTNEEVCERFQSEEDAIDAEIHYNADNRNGNKSNFYARNYYNDKKNGVAKDTRSNNISQEGKQQNYRYIQDRNIYVPPQRRNNMDRPRSYSGSNNRNTEYGEEFNRRPRSFPGCSNSNNELTKARDKCCFHCGSKFHFKNKCPDLNRNIWFQKDSIDDEEQVLFLGETLNKAVLDSGAAKTICGKQWYNCYVQALSKHDQESIQTYECKRSFKFGFGSANCEEYKIIPIELCGTRYYITVYLVECDLPLLISLQTMRDLNIKLNFEKDMIEINGKQQALTYTTTGHYSVCILNDEVLIVKEFENKQSKAKHKDLAIQLHKRLGHAKSDRIIKLIKNAGESPERELIKELKSLDEKCDICMKYRRDTTNPKVSVPLADEFNELVCMDLKTIKEGYTMLHCIDYLTKFSAAAIVKSKDPEEILQKFFHCWISVFGPPKKIMTDNGGEFNAEKVRDGCQFFNIEFRTTAAYSPWSNGLCERHNGILSTTVQKIVEDSNVPVEIALSWGLNAKNSLTNVYGFSPYQLVFGKNPRLPSVVNNKLPAMNTTTISNVVRDNLNALYQAREQFIKAESSIRLKRALAGRVENSPCHRFFNGEKIYFKRVNCDKWRGPATVIGQDGSQVLIKNGGQILRVHRCKVVSKSKAEIQLDGKNNIEIDSHKIEQNDTSENDNVEKCQEERSKDNHCKDNDSEDDSHLESESDSEETSQRQNEVLNIPSDGEQTIYQK